MSLSNYQKKRNFSNTPEPAGKKGKKKKARLFVVQRHKARNLHYDFRIEMDGVLKSWAVPKGPSMKAGEKRLAVMVEDHPLDYGNFYGEIPKGNYGAGTVEILDNGTYTLVADKIRNVSDKDILKQLEKGELKIDLKGKLFKGLFTLVRMNDTKGNNWLLIKKKDNYALNDFVISNKKSVKSKVKTKAKSKANNDKVKSIEEVWQQVNKPMLARLATTIRNKKEWIYEMKYDGYRAMTKISESNVAMISRNGLSFNKAYGSLISELEKIKDDVILDGEVVIEDETGKSSFQKLQNYSTSQKGELKYYVFDILFLNGHSVVNFELKDRKELLLSLFQKYKFKNIFYSQYIIEKGEELFDQLSKKGYEGVIAKSQDSLYLPGRRSDSWEKFKIQQSQETIICGYTLPKNSRKYFGSIILGIYSGDKIKYAGNCGTGFSETSLKELYQKFKKLERESSPFEEVIKMNGLKGKPVWVQPSLICQVKFLEWTNDGRMRNPVFMGLRMDKKPSEVMKETAKTEKERKGPGEDNVLVVAGKKVKITNPGKIFWPEERITKGDVISYYSRISKFILPYLKNRPQSLNRHPNGIGGKSFYQKDMDVKQLPEWGKTVRVYSKSNKKYLNYFLCNDEASLIYMANLGCIEINPWHSTTAKLDNPDYLMLDLDPGNNKFSEVVDAALVIKEICDELKIPAWCKTSGASGLHVYIPAGKKYSYDETRTFAEIIANLAHEQLPKTTTLERSIAKRKNKLYLDYLQNSKGQTIAAPYCIRPKLHATVSTPLLWKEVNHQLSPEMFTIHNIEKRLQKIGDVWEGVLGKGISLKKILNKL